MPAKSDVTMTPPFEADPDVPLSDAEFQRGRAAMLARTAREATGLSQQAFANRYGIPCGSLRDWEQGRRIPDAATQSYLRVIARMPERVGEALDGKPCA